MCMCDIIAHCTCSVAITVVSLLCDGFLPAVWHINSCGKCLRPSHGVHRPAQLLSLVPSQLNCDTLFRLNLHSHVLGFLSLPLSLHFCTSVYMYVCTVCMHAHDMYMHVHMYVYSVYTCTILYCFYS